MADQRDIPESERSKSTAIRSFNSNERIAAFDVGEKVKMKVSRDDGNGGTRMQFDDFTVAERRYKVGRYEYSLNDSNGLYNDGKYFLEAELRPET
ncbi:hypothetical protein BDW02DRAFT_572725 [Decorospora gaudefroyi]|uniref:Uncharacterized protein n=1 Tax=Decorospora gaudefroyi TaxID=184978 RepID=A0A6A5K8E6_9PLEO|nr:hypothetical protein BDW02DRAFT_572725 [Decorospora gaudefroyi]